MVRAISPASTEVLVKEAPPAPRDEWITDCPGPAYVWIPGAWAWHGRWVWEGGHWTRPPHPNAVWMPHRYSNRGGANYYTHGDWSYYY